jgi:phosphatidylinositol-3-phosphatase
MNRVAMTGVVVMLLAACSSSTTSTAPSAATEASAAATAVPVTAAVTRTAAVATAAAPAESSTASATAPTPSGPCGRTAAAPAAYDHVIWIWMENKDSIQVLDASAAPFINSLATSCGSASNYVDHGIHPSLPNYLAVTSGDTHGVSDDEFPAAHPLPVDNIFRQVRAAGKTARSYEEAMPVGCALQSTERYAVKHNPAAYYSSATDRAACQTDNVSFDHFLPDLGSDLPAFSLITPDMCNDMHDCPVATGDAWLQDVVTAITTSPTYNEGRTAVFVMFDESEGAGTMPFVAIAPSISPGTRVDSELSHYSALAFTEDALGITERLGGAANAPSLAAAFGL